MVKIEVSKETRQQIDRIHEEYIEQISLPKLEELLTKLNKREKRRQFLITLFGGTPKRRKERLVKFCLTSNLTMVLQSFDKAFFHIYGIKFCSDLANHKQLIEITRGDLDYVLNYDGFNVSKKLSSGNKWSRHAFITNLGVKVCPYCNRQYITSYEDEANGDKTTADADHYYPKAEYPVLQMNIFNLIPSCNVCNSKMKGSSDKRHLYPYEDPSNSLVFEIPIEAGDQVSEILINTKGNKRAEASKEVFKLDKVYQAHRNIAAEVKQNVEEYFEYGEKVLEVFQGLKVPFNIFSTLFSFMGKDIAEEPLIKLKQDIFVQLKAELKK